ncbi:MAG: N-acetylglucosamine-6-phosphate deacetylase [Propioniciclava sp.]|uniref:N-acetylglucosamine-6-phosphate deacetylase n=1 Tax=Propioniciclava sp. TaxID=2038686 RepID=UPI0039E442D0
MLITAGTVVTGSEILRPGWLEVAGGRVRALGSGEPPRPLGVGDVALGEVTVVPGFVDMHTHGAGGGAFPEATAEASRAAVAMHRAHGTTALIASLVSAHPDELLREVSVLTEQVEDGLIGGIHLEGPWLAPCKKGAHDPTALRNPEAAEIARLFTAGRGTIKMVTIAPELDGAMAAIGQMVDLGAIAAIGHTDASLEQARAAIDAGASVATHLFNAMRPVHHREPGPIVALVEDERVTVEMIGDGVHLHPALYTEVCRRVGDDRVTLVTDAMAAAGMADGAYVLGALPVEVSGGVAHIAGTDTIAGSTATMDQLFRFALAHGGGSADESLLRAVRQTSVNPARVMGFATVGLGAGMAADAVVLDASSAVVRVLKSGEWVHTAG